MKLLKSVSCGLAGVAIAALWMPVEKAEAAVIAYSSLQVSNFAITLGGEIIDGGSFSAANTTVSSASLDALNTSDADVSAAGSDAALSCLGDCGGIGQNDFTAVHLANPTWHFARSDASLVGSLLTAGGLTAATVAETQLTSLANSSGSATVHSLGTVSTIEFTTDQSGDISLRFDVLGELRAFSDDADGVAVADLDFGLSLVQLSGGVIDIDVSSVGGETDFAGLNEAVFVLGTGQESYAIDDTFFVTMRGLLADTAYRLQLSMNSDINASSRSATAVSEPGPLSLLSLGLLGLAAFAAHRRRSFGELPAAR